MERFEVEKVREDFPVLSSKIDGNPLVYLDSAATSQKPRQVVDAISRFYEKMNANPLRSVHRLAEDATEAYESARAKVAGFINASPEEIIFVRNTTEAINLVSYALPFDAGSRILTTYLEHHSNLLPWLKLREKGMFVDMVGIDNNLELDMGRFENIRHGTQLVAVTHGSNVTGTVTDIEKISKLAHDSGAMVLVDAAQTVPHMKIDVKKMDPDFLAFSGHKMLGPMGVGVLYVNKRAAPKLGTFMTGGEMVSSVSLDEIKYADVPARLEAGTPNVAGAYALGTAIDYLESIGMGRISSYEKDLVDYTYQAAKKIPGISIHSGKSRERGPIFSFTLEHAHPHDIAYLLNKRGIAIRSGFQCAQPLIENGLHVRGGVARASLYLYNTYDEIDSFVRGLEEVVKLYG